MLSEGRVRQIHTYTLHFPPAVINISRHRYPSVILIPLFLCLFLSSSGYQPASRRKQHPSRAASYTSPRTYSRQHPISQWIFKNIHIYTTRIAQRRSSILFTRFQRSSLAERGRWKEIFYSFQVSRRANAENSRSFTEQQVLWLYNSPVTYVYES